MRERILTNFRTQISEYVTNKTLPSFGPSLGTVNGRQAADIVVTHRITSKLELPSEADAAGRRDTSILEVLEADKGEPRLRHSDDMRMASLRLSYWFRDFKPSYGFRAPSGASAKPTGDVQDILLKLTDLENWEVSPNLAKYAATIAYRNQKLKKMVKHRFRQEFPAKTMNDHFRAKVGINGFLIFREMFLALVNYNCASRVTTVPKDNNNDRVITCEPLWDMICQLSFMCDMRSHIYEKLGYDLDTRGELHKTLLPHSENITVDLKKASDNLTWEWVKTYWPSNMVKHFDALRPSLFHAVLGDMDIYHVPRMFAPMGSGITFDVMTFSLLSVLRFDRSATVFGDDIIVKAKNKKRAYQALADMGMVVNVDKSFVTGAFRESCGGMYHADIGYIVSYDFKWPETGPDWVILTNKLAMLLKANQVSYELNGILLSTWELLCGTFPRVAFEGTSDISLRSDVVTGVGTYAPHTWRPSSALQPSVVSILEGFWHRQVHVNMAYETKNTPAGMEPCPVTEYALFLLNGRNTNSVTTKTHVTSRRVDSFSATPLWSVPLASVIPT